MSVGRSLSKGAPRLESVARDLKDQAAQANFANEPLKIPSVTKYDPATPEDSDKLQATARADNQLVPGGDGTQALDKPGNKMTQYIPSEVLAAYLAIIGIFAAGSATDTTGFQWIAFFVAIGLIWVVSALQWVIDRKSGKNAASELASLKPKNQQALKDSHVVWSPWAYVFTPVTASLAFTAYVMTIPGGPFEARWDWATGVGAGSALILTIILPMISEALGVEETRPFGK